MRYSRLAGLILLTFGTATSAVAAAPDEASSMTDETITVVALLVAKPGQEERVAKELQALLAPTRAEKGCIHYDMHRALDDPTRFLFYENWQSEADLQAHLASPHIEAWFELSKELLAQPIEITRWKKDDS